MAVPIKVWSGAEWLDIGVQGGTVLYQNEEPASPETGMIWIDADSETSVLNDEDYLTISTASATYVNKNGGDTITSSGASVVPLTLKGASGQSTDFMKFQDSTGYDLLKVNQNAVLDLQSESALTAIALRLYEDNSSSRHINFYKYRGTTASPSVVQDDDDLGLIRFYGYSAAASIHREAARIEAEVDGEPDSSGDTSDMPGRLMFSTTPNGESSVVERVRFTSGGSVLIGTTTSGDAGAGDLVVNGGVFLGGSAAGNELDDYEEGTFTPIFEPTTGAFGSITYGQNYGVYRKIGNQVFVSIYLNTDAVTVGTAAGDLRIADLPFTCATITGVGNADRGVMSTCRAQAWGTETPLYGEVQPAQTYLVLRYRNAVDSGDADIQVSHMATGSTDNIINLAGFYFTA